VSSFSGIPFKSVDIAKPEVFIGGLLGSCLVMVFSSLAIHAVGNTAQEVLIRSMYAVRDYYHIWTPNPRLHSFL